MTDSPTFMRKPKPLSDEPGFVDGIPVEELVKMTREFTARITNEDRQRVAAEIAESNRTITTAVPYILGQFFKGKSDLDVDLSRRFPSAPVVQPTTFLPEPGKRMRYGMAQYLSQDGAAGLTVEMLNIAGDLEFSFLLQGMIAVRFSIAGLAEPQRIKFSSLLRRKDGIVFLWSRERWEKDYLIFVVRERFTRVYAFAPGRFEASCRLTPDGLEQFNTWLAALWIDGVENSDSKPDALGTDSSANW